VQAFLAHAQRLVESAAWDVEHWSAAAAGSVDPVGARRDGPARRAGGRERAA
jgi:hypothetical protein